MTARIEALLEHDNTDECVGCRSRDFAAEVVLPAVAAWEASADLPRGALALHSAAALLGVVLADNLPRDDVEAALARLLDEIEAETAEDRALGGPAQGTA